MPYGTRTVAPSPSPSTHSSSSSSNHSINPYSRPLSPLFNTRDTSPEAPRIPLRDLPLCDQIFVAPTAKDTAAPGTFIAYPGKLPLSPPSTASSSSGSDKENEPPLLETEGVSADSLSPAWQGIQEESFRRFCGDESRRVALWQEIPYDCPLRPLLRVYWNLVNSTGQPSLALSVQHGYQKAANLGAELMGFAALVSDAQRPRLASYVTGAGLQAKNLADFLHADFVSAREQAEAIDKSLTINFLILRDNGLDHHGGALFYETGYGPSPTAGYDDPASPWNANAAAWATANNAWDYGGGWGPRKLRWLHHTPQDH
jgi:hypothetical protein